VLYDENAEVLFRECSEAEYKKIREGFVRPFELLTGRLYQIEIYKTESAVYLLYDFHHIIFDGASVGIFINDLAKAYRGETLETEQHSAFELALSENGLSESVKFIEAKAYFDSIIGDGE
jgi:gramicidin S synthase 2